MRTKITLINSTTREVLVDRDAIATDTGDRLGGKEHGAVAKAITTAVTNLDSEQFLKNVDIALDQVKLITDRIIQGANRLRAKEITLGLAISAEGSIGIATAGAEASIEITFEIRQS
jgi:Trypsin-co-occurring domain 1